jgi:hypothetical protein
MTRLLNWSVIKIFPGWLKPAFVFWGGLEASTDGKAASARNTTASARRLFFQEENMFHVLRIFEGFIAMVLS